MILTCHLYARTVSLWIRGSCIYSRKHGIPLQGPQSEQCASGATRQVTVSEQHCLSLSSSRHLRTRHDYHVVPHPLFRWNDLSWCGREESNLKVAFLQH